MADPIKQLAKNAKPQTLSEQFYERLKAGEFKTVKDWAYELFGHDTMEYTKKVHSMLQHLRRRGVMAFPVLLDGADGPRKVKIVNRDATHFMEAYNRHAKNCVEPNLVKSFFYAETFVQEHPRLRDQIAAQAEHLLEIAAQANEKLLGLPYGKSGAILGSGKAAPGRKPAA